MHVDYLIIGQGICGSFLANYLLDYNVKFLIIDEDKKNTSSKVASGVINPITGRRLVRTWMIEEILPFTIKAYQNLEEKYKTSFIQQLDIIDFHTTPQMKLAFDERIKTEFEYLKQLIDQDKFNPYFNHFFGADIITKTYLIDVNHLIKFTKNELHKSNNLITQKFDINRLIVKENKIEYQDITANKIIFCDGIENTNNPYFSLLPYSLVKGEALLVEINDLPRDYMYKFGTTIVPWQNNLFWVGSNYEWNFIDDNPTVSFKQKTEQTLQQILKIPFKTHHHIAAVRPANIERRPFIGFHAKYKNVGVFNGMGTKGCSLTPYFANELCKHLIHQHPLDKEVDIKRFEKILSRN